MFDRSGKIVNSTVFVLFVVQSVRYVACAQYIRQLLVVHSLNLSALTCPISNQWNGPLLLMQTVIFSVAVGGNTTIGS